MENELKPCPFCGNNAKIVKSRNIAAKTKEVYYVQCVGCEVRTPIKVEINTTVEAWNRRCNDGT